MITQKEIATRTDFYIDPWNLSRITNRPIRKIRVKKIKVGKIRRYIDLKIIDLKDTDVYRYLDGGKETEAAYEKYCEKYCRNNNQRGISQYNNLIKTFDISDYDIRKGAIVIDGFNTIIEGQHRCCILLKKYGPEVEINVVQIFYAGHELKKLLKLIFFNVRKLFERS